MPDATSTLQTDNHEEVLKALDSRLKEIKDQAGLHDNLVAGANALNINVPVASVPLNLPTVESPNINLTPKTAETLVEAEKIITEIVPPLPTVPILNVSPVIEKAPITLQPEISLSKAVTAPPNVTVAPIANKEEVRTEVKTEIVPQKIEQIGPVISMPSMRKIDIANPNVEEHQTEVPVASDFVVHKIPEGKSIVVVEFERDIAAIDAKLDQIEEAQNKMSEEATALTTNKHSLEIAKSQAITHERTQKEKLSRNIRELAQNMVDAVMTKAPQKDRLKLQKEYDGLLEELRLVTEEGITDDYMPKKGADVVSPETKIDLSDKTKIKEALLKQRESIESDRDEWVGDPMNGLVAAALVSDSLSIN
ncbi:MAG: hypothetical protein HZA95_03465 [Candidatus Vogelbacteria bacterium]|nr:hypothetical protein [Candidatus Vogelbacteria bacterium]